jgi:hypothetical protein
MTLNEWRMKLETSDNAIDEIEKLLISEAERDKKRKRLSAANAEILRTHLTYIKNNHYCPKQRETVLTGRAVADFPVV